MNRQWRVFLTAAVVVAAAVAGSLYHLAAQDRPAPADKKPDQAPPDSPELAAVRKTAEAFAKAFNAGDAKAIAAFWTAEGEYVGPDGETVHGRNEIEKGYVEFFKKHPKAALEVEIETVRRLGRDTVLEEGALKLKLPGDDEPGVSRYSVLHVREDDGWKMAAVREWIPDPAHLVTVKQLEWLIGEWTAKTDHAELRIRYAWDEDKVFLRGRYTLKRGDKLLSSGTHVIGKNPTGGLRAWTFDSSGTFGEAVWMRDGSRWVSESAGTLPDGSELTAVNLLVPIGKDAFTWQSVQRVVAGSPLPDAAPVKVTRIKTDK
jgi:uncharacterized protein (TIGR02246 family)